MAFELTEKNLKKLLRERKQYPSCFELNEILHLQCKGIIRIANLEKFTGLQTLYLQGNAIEEISGLDCLVNLRCLCLNQNLIRDISGLHSLQELSSLDLSENLISSCKGLEGLRKLKTLSLSKNYLVDAESFDPLGSLGESLLCLDISHNKISDAAVVDVLQRNHGYVMRLLRLVGNPVVSSMAWYRKVTICKFASLRYLDDQPVFGPERRLAYSFVNGGIEAERKERQKIREEEERKSAQHHSDFQRLVYRQMAHTSKPMSLWTAAESIATEVENGSQ